MRFNPLRGQNWLALLLAFCLAVGVWYVVTVHDQLEAQLEIRLDYKGVPDNLIIMDGMIPKMTVRLRGPATLMRAILPRDLEQVVNLSQLQKGRNIISLRPTTFAPSVRAFEIKEITPPRLVLLVEARISRTVPVKPVFSTARGEHALKVLDVIATPATVQVRGPESQVNALHEVEVLVPLSLATPAGQYNFLGPLDVPRLVTVTPGAARVEYTVVSDRVMVPLSVPVVVNVQDKRPYTAEPRTVMLKVEMPEALAKNPAYIGRARILATPPPLEPGARAKAELQPDLPEGMTLLEPLYTEIVVSRGKK